MKVLVIDDSPEIAEVVSLCFELRWPDTVVLSAPDGPTGLRLLREESPDLVILDVGLPAMDGFQVLRQIRSTSDVPVIMLTVRDADTDIARALEAGADDYITKPFSHIELMARVQAVLRRARDSQVPTKEPPFEAGGIKVDFAAREVWVEGQKVKLTPTEFNLLALLVRNAGRVVPYEELLAKVWGPQYTDAPNYLKVHIQHLRQKLGDNPQKPRLIVTEWKVGYKFVKPKDKDAEPHPTTPRTEE
ncbi:Transcriptional regulatory protein KdpE [bacterium HR23]|nr:Transcriptional regulatory protein KdpE [bacterium HR23]